MRSIWISMGLVALLGATSMGCGGGGGGQSGDAATGCEPACTGATPYCDATGHRCVACLTDKDCPGDFICGVTAKGDGAPAACKAV